MAYSIPTKEDFKARFPEFADLGDPLIVLLLEEADAFTDARWDDRDRKIAVLHLAAHAALQITLTQSAFAAAAGSSSSSEGGSTTTDTQEIKSVSFGSSSVTFGSASTKSSSSIASSSSSPGLRVGAAYVDTIYGQMFLSLRRRNIGGPVVV